MVKSLKMAVSERVVEQVFDNCDVDKDGKLNKKEAREFYKRAFKFKDGVEMTDEFEAVLFYAMDNFNDDLLQKTNVNAFCTQVMIEDEPALTDRITELAENTEENARLFTKTKMQQTFGDEVADKYGEDGNFFGAVFTGVTTDEEEKKDTKKETEKDETQKLKEEVEALKLQKEKLELEKKKADLEKALAKPAAEERPVASSEGPL